MAAADALTTCPKCKQTIFAGAPKCQFCGVTLSTSPSTTKTSNGFVSGSTSTAANGWCTACGVFWLIWNALAIVGWATGRNDPNLKRQSVAFQMGDSLGNLIGFAILLYFLSISIGMISRSTWACRNGYFVSWLGTIVGIGFILIIGAWLSVLPIMIIPIVYFLILVVLTFVTRWAVKNATA